MFYIYKLKNLDETEYDGIETYVMDCYEMQDLKWFPASAIVLQKGEAEEDGIDLETKLTELKEKILSINKKLIRIARKREKKDKAMYQLMTDSCGIMVSSAMQRKNFMKSVRNIHKTAR